jgi:glycoside/pentoside/hexuronide:cation symporter, GPH family
MSTPASPPAPTEQTAKVGIGEKIGYGLGDTASNLYWKLFENFQLIFYTDVFGISAAAAGTMFFVTKLWDAINDPVMGAIADRTRTAWGRFRPWLLWGAIPFAVTGILTFYTPDWSPRGKLVYAYLTYTLVFMAYTAINIPYGALMGVLSPSSVERTSISTWRFVLAFAGGLVVQKFTEPLVAFFGGTRTVMDGGVPTEVVDRQTGFFWTVVVYACVAVVLFLVTFATTRERVRPERAAGQSLARDVRDLLGSRPWLVLMLVGLFQILAGWTRGSATAYYFTYYVHAPFGNFLVAGTVAGIVGMLLTQPLRVWLGARNLMILMNLATAGLTAAFVWLGPEQIGLMYGLHLLAALVAGPVPVLLWAMYADVADHSEWKQGRRATGLLFSAATFSQKLGGALGGALPGWLLAWCAFQAPINGLQQEQGPDVLRGIVAMMSLIPAGFLACSAACMLFYPLNDQLLRQMENDLRERRLSSAKQSHEAQP